MIDPVKFKKILVALLKILVAIELIKALSDGFSKGNWDRFIFDLIVAGILFVMWGRITTTLRYKKEQYKLRMQISVQKIRLRDAFIFSLLWSDEIYRDIPLDRKRLVVISYTLIAFGLITAFTEIGGSGLMPLVISGALVLAAVNLLTWVVSVERSEKESLQTELKLAHDVQVSLMPENHPSVEGYDIAAISIPAKEVGGDHFDYSYLDSNGLKFAISVFDVSGKGMQAAMSAVFTSGAYTGEVKRSDSAAQILTRLNKAVYTHTKRGHFVAFLLTVIDLKTKMLTFANAGQTKPLLKSSGELQWLDSVGVHFPLGVVEEHHYEDRSIQLRSGDVLFLLTDGFTEAMNAQKESYGNERLEHFIKQLDTNQLSTQDLLQRITREIKFFVADAPQHDDMTMVVVKVL